MIEQVPKDILQKMYRDMVTGRKLDEFFLKLAASGDSDKDVPHRGAGEEAVVVGICANLRKDDYIKVTTRTRHCLTAKGMSIKDVLATKSYRDQRGVGGHCNYYDHEYGIIPYSGTLGEDVMVATGAALAAKLRNTDRVAVAIYGDASGNRPSIHSSMVFASAWKLPIIFVIQNNQYGMGTSVRKSYAIEDLSDRAKGFGFPGKTVDGNDVLEVYEVSKAFIERAREGNGPALIAAETYRLYGHYEGEGQKYRPEGEAEEWSKKDPLPRYTKQLLDMNVLTKSDIEKLDHEIEAEIEESMNFARSLPKWKIEDYHKNCIAEL
ncbi:MAG: thiamine pyrophosphate-dependent dehydrogenase E1 component subunit alpha [Deltaproteobacteria bacterium]|nr:thiamine pyrophosphate-dependent dehydrogenase E1 component subunit alpha [Deltaproteobacteria bacterium]